MFPSKKKVPVEVIEAATNSCKYTPDAVELETREKVPLFVCNEMQQQHRAAGVLGNAVFQMVGFTVDRTYRMWKTIKGEAVVLEEPDPQWMTGYRPAHIKGELYFVDGPEFKYIDKFMQNGLESQRSHVRIVLPRTEYHKSYPESRHSTENWTARIQTAYMYVGIREYWDQLIDRETFQILTPHEDTRLKSYYSFEPEDAEWTTQEPVNSPTESHALSAEVTARIAREIISASTTTDTRTALNALITEIVKEIKKT